MILKHHITTKNLENGRSMVEMLGTLAIIGVLSVGAIAGYSYGMNKYRANQTMHDISLRTVDLITQASQGRTELSLAEWDKEITIYDFANPAYSDDGLIMFDVGTTKKMPQSVCQMVFDGLANTAVQIDINAVHANSNETCGTDNTMTFYFAGGGNGTGGETGEQCVSTVCGTCQKCDASTETCVPVSDYEQKCTVDGQSGWCVGETCQAETCNCDKGYFCSYTSDSCEHPTPSGNCVEAEPKFRTVEIADITYYISKNSMSWWNAVSACKALGNKQLLTVEDIVVRNDGDTTGYLTDDHVKTSLGKELYSEMGYKDIWSSILYDSCRAYIVNLNNGYVRYIDRDLSDTRGYNGFYAVCR